MFPLLSLSGGLLLRRLSCGLALGLCRSLSGRCFYRSGIFTHHGCNIFFRLRILFRQRDLDVRDAALIAEGATHRSRANTLHARTFVGDGALDVKIVHVDVEPFFVAQVGSVLNGGTHQLVNVGRDALLGEGQRIERAFDAHALDQVEDEAHLLRRYPLKSCFSSEFHSQLPSKSFNPRSFDSSATADSLRMTPAG